uniref:Uncharacterized protein n=1 Tax=Panagrolaimus davidi TaxID=227884 RepID=A0A914PNR3_9BILA
MALFVCIIVLLSFTSQLIVEGCIPTPDIDEGAMIPIPTTMAPVESAPSDKCRIPLKFMDVCVNPKVGTCSFDNVIKVTCETSALSTRNGDSGPFMPRSSADFICDNSGIYYIGTVNNVVTTIRCD